MRFHVDKFVEEFKKGGNKITTKAEGDMKILLSFMNNDDTIPTINDAAYMFATVWHECANTFAPIEEYGKGKGRPYGKTADNGQVFYGRGYVQITWDYNYKRIGKAIGLDLYNNPSLALHYDVAYKIMSEGMRKGLFTGVGLPKYIKPGQQPNYVGARRIINGTDKAEAIAEKARKAQAYFEASVVTGGA